MMTKTDPVFHHSGGRIQDADSPHATTPIEPPGWYFWTETWADYIGPHDSEEACRLQLIEYFHSL